MFGGWPLYPSTYDHYPSILWHCILDQYGWGGEQTVQSLYKKEISATVMMFICIVSL